MKWMGNVDDVQVEGEGVRTKARKLLCKENDGEENEGEENENMENEKGKRKTLFSSQLKIRLSTFLPFVTLNKRLITKPTVIIIIRITTGLITLILKIITLNSTINFKN